MANNLVNGETFAFVPNEDMAPVNIESKITYAHYGITYYVWQCGHVVTASLSFAGLELDGGGSWSRVMAGFPAPASGRFVPCVIGKDDGTVVLSAIQSNGDLEMPGAAYFPRTGEALAEITYITNDMSAYES